MKRFLLSVVLATTLALTSCQFDDSNIWDKLDEYGQSIKDHEQRISALEELCKQMNTNISSLQTIVGALQNNDYITAVVPVVKDGITIGYTITFSKSQPITIYHGKDGANGADGKDGYTPQIGVMKDTDGIYYWTLDGEWLLDAKGNKIKAVGTDGADGKDGANGTDGKDGQDGTNGSNGKDGQDGTNGTDGKDGITPQLKIENDYWYVSYDNGATWVQLGKATGKDGQNGTDGKDGTNGQNGKDGDSFFLDVSQDANNVYFTLADGTEIVLPKLSSLNISFSAIGDIVCMPGKNITINYTIFNANSEVHIATISQNGWQAVVKEESATTGYITVTAPNPLTDSPIIVLVSDSNKTIMRTLSFVEGFAAIENTSFTLTYEATVLNVNVQSNLNYSVQIPDSASSWITLEGITTRAAVRNDIIKLNIAENSEITARSATLQLIFNGESVGAIEVYQQGIKGEIIKFEDSVVEKICLDKWDTSGDGLLSVLEAASVTNTNDLKGVFEGNADITSFNELKYFTGLTAIPIAAFKGCINLREITIPDSIKTLGVEAFYDCKALTSLDISATIITYLPTACFYNCISLANVILPNSIKSISSECFYGCKNLSKINLPESITYISGFEYSGLTEISIPDNVTEICTYAFMHCEELKKVELGAKVKTIESSAFSHCTKLSTITIPASVRDINYSAFSNSGLSNITIEYGIQRLGSHVFHNCDNLTSVTLPNSVYEIGTDLFSYCDALTKVQLSDNITNIPYWTFAYCNNLKEIILPANLENIEVGTFKRLPYEGDSAFDVKYDIYMRSTTPPTFTDSLQGSPRIYVPSGSKEVYEQNEWWNRYYIYEYEL